MRAAVAVVLCAACGRIGFDASASSDANGSGSDGATIDAPGAPFTVELPVPSGIADIAVLPDGGVIAVGTRNGTLTLDGITVPSIGEFDVLVIALDADGHVRWMHQYGGPGSDTAITVAVAPDGSIYVGGLIENTASLGGPAIAGTNVDAFIAKYTADGDWIWDRRFGGMEISFEHADAVLDIAVRDDGDVFVVGRVAGTVDFGMGNVPESPATTDAFVARYSPANQLRWARRFGDAETNGFSGLAVANDAVYVGGYYSGTPNFGTGTMPTRGGNDAVMMRMNATSTSIEWLKTFGGPDNQRIYNLAFHNNSVVGAGYYWETIDLPNSLPTAQRADGIVVAYNTIGGDFVGAYTYGGPGCDFLYSAHAADGQVVAAGTFQDTVMFEAPASAMGLSDSVAFGFDGSGFQWHRAFGNSTDEIATSAGGGLSTALYVGGMRDIQLDAGCYGTPLSTTGYIRRF